MKYKPLTPDEYQQMLLEQQASYEYDLLASDAYIAFLEKFIPAAPAPIRETDPET